MMNDSPPHTALPVERQVLGACLLDDAACATAVGLLADVPEAFSRADHRTVFETIVRLFSEGEPTDLVTVSEEVPGLRQDMTEWTAEVGATTHVERQCRILQEHWMTRRTLRLIDRARGWIDAEDTDIFEGLEALQHRLFEIQVPGQQQAHVRHAAADAVETAARWEQGERTDTVPSGLPSLDEAVGGFFRRELTTLAAQTGAGKTSLLIQIADSQAARIAQREEADGCALIFSCEMGAEQLVHRAAAARSQVDLRALRSGQASAKDYAAFRAALGDLADLPLYIDDHPAPTIAHVTARCQRLKAKHGSVDFVGVDYLEKIAYDAASEELRVSGIAKALKRLARQIDTAVVALCQYSRKAAGTTGPPSDAWLRYSGKIEHESALILHWWWPGWFVDKGVDPHDVDEYILQQPEVNHGWGYVSVTKNRFGAAPPPTGVPLYFDPQHTRFLDPRDPEVARADVLPPAPGGSRAPF